MKTRKNLITGGMVALLLLLGSVQFAEAKVRLPKLVSNKMVLQRDTELKIWGWADAGEKVTVRFQGKHYFTETDNEGRWEVTLPPHKAGGPYLLEVNEIIIRDVLVGDVWLCSGQSNQETPIARLVEKFPEIDVSNNHMIRHYKVPTQNTAAEGVQEEIAGNAVWHSGVASEVMNWTALAYFYAVEAYNKTKVPQGMLVSSLGGSAIESWISQEHLKEFPDLVIDREALKGLAEAESDKGIAGKWASPDLDDSDWHPYTMPGFWHENGVKARGTVWHRKSFNLPASMAGRHATLYMGTMVDSDSVFINGTFVGFTSYTYPPRKYQVPAGILREGKNVIAVKLTDRSGRGGFWQDKNYKLVGDEATVDLAGSDWKYKVGMDLGETEQYRKRLTNLRRAGSGLYNGMIYPIRDYKVKAAIWYQGESNAGNPRYSAYMSALITNWREVLQQPELPFLLVQLPNFMEKREQPSESGWAQIREAQLKAFKEIPHTALAVICDVGEWNDIHPLDKKTVAQRLFLGARRVVFGEKLTACGPIYESMEVKGGKIILTFTETGRGLTVRGGGKLKHFAIAGEDRKFVWADAVISGNKVIVSSPQVQQPVAVRYGWSDNPEDANLYNKEGLPASPFRTDSW